MKTDINLVAYGIRAIRNAQLDRWRSQRRLTELTDDEMAERCLETGSSSEMVEALQAYGKLEERCRPPRSCRRGQRYADISIILEMTEGAVAGAISRCRSYLVKLIRGKPDGPQILDLDQISRYLDGELSAVEMREVEFQAEGWEPSQQRLDAHRHASDCMKQLFRDQKGLSLW